MVLDRTYVLAAHPRPVTACDAESCGAWRYDLPDHECPVLLVGEDNPRSEDPRHALYPYPVHCAGYNFAENIANVGVGHQLATWRTNLCNPTWSIRAAVERARELVDAPGVPWRVIIMLGTKVSGAFERALADRFSPPLKVQPFTTHRVVRRVLEGSRTRAEIDWMLLVSLPHPSGRCRAWSNPAQIHRARALLASASPEWYGTECHT